MPLQVFCRRSYPHLQHWHNWKLWSITPNWHFDVFLSYMLPNESNIVSFCFLQQKFFPVKGHSASGRFLRLLACTHCFSSTNFLFDGDQNILMAILIPWVRLLQFWTYTCEQAFDFLAGVLRYRCPHHCPSSWCHPCCEGSSTTWRCHHLRPGWCSFLQIQKY